MREALSRRENIPLLVAAAVLLTVILAWLAPAEATLGEAVKLVYVHAALMWVGFGLLTIGGILGLIFVLRPKEVFIKWSLGCSAMGIALFVVTGVLGMVTAKITWGGVFWAEPRMVMLFQILLAGAVAVAAGKISGSKPLVGISNFGLALVSWILIVRTERVIHPDSPIFSSDSLAIKVFPLLITATIAFAGLQAIRYWISKGTD